MLGSKPRVYLCGPISGLTYNQARKSWRQEVALVLNNFGIDALSPLRAQEIDETQDGNTLIDKLGDPNKVTWSAKGVTTKDRFLVEQSDLIFANFIGAERVSIGSCIEFGWADAYRKPIILCIEDKNMHDHGMINEIAGFRVPTLEEGMLLTVDLLSTGA